MRCPTNVEDLTHVPGIYIQPHSDYLSPCKNNVDEKPEQSVHYLTRSTVDLLFFVLFVVFVIAFDDAMRTESRLTPSSSFSACARPLPSCSSLFGEGNARKSFAVTCM